MHEFRQFGVSRSADAGQIFADEAGDGDVRRAAGDR
jgi:hypothetical protein